MPCRHGMAVLQRVRRHGMPHLWVHLPIRCLFGPGRQKFPYRLLQIAFAIDKELARDDDVLAFFESSAHLEQASSSVQAEYDLSGLEAPITESDDSFRQATTALGAIIANHMISAVDAYVSGGSPQHERPLAVWAEPGSVGTRWTAFLRLGTP